MLKKTENQSKTGKSPILSVYSTLRVQPEVSDGLSGKLSVVFETGKGDSSVPTR